MLNKENRSVAENNDKLMLKTIHVIFRYRTIFTLFHCTIVWILFNVRLRRVTAVFFLSFSTKCLVLLFGETNVEILWNSYRKAVRTTYIEMKRMMQDSAQNIKTYRKSGLVWKFISDNRWCTFLFEFVLLT